MCATENASVLVGLWHCGDLLRRGMWATFVLLPVAWLVTLFFFLVAWLVTCTIYRDSRNKGRWLWWQSSNFYSYSCKPSFLLSFPFSPLTGCPPPSLLSLLFSFFLSIVSSNHWFYMNPLLLDSFKLSLSNIVIINSLINSTKLICSKEKSGYANIKGSLGVMFSQSWSHSHGPYRNTESVQRST